MPSQNFVFRYYGNIFRLDEKELELRESEEALQLTALQSVQLKQHLENASQQSAE